ncbi:MAG: bifunctional metallophosphatase/5'-nucleotidase [Halanaerobiaceae bacterium]
MKEGKYTLVILLIVLCFLSLPVSTDEVEAGEKIVVTHINDLHSMITPFTVDGKELGGIARMATVLDTIRAENDNVLFLNAGDIFAGSGEKYQENYELPHFGYRGLLDVELMNEMRLDALVPGNHHYDFGLRWSERILEDAEFDVLSSNAVYRNRPDVEDKNGELMYEPYTVYKFDETRVGVIGVSTDDYIQSSQVDEEDQIETLKEQVPRVEKEADIIIALSHMGRKHDREIAQEVDGIDLIVGGHSHTELKTPLQEEGTLIVQAGSFGKSLGKMELEVEGERIVNRDYELIQIDDSIDPDSEIKDLIAKRERIGELVYSDLSTSEEEQSTLGNFITNAMCWYSGADLAMIDSDLAEGVLERGEITASEFFEVFWPHRSRTIGPEKDLNEKQLIEVVGRHRDKEGFFLDAFTHKSDRLESVVVLDLTGEEILEILQKSRRENAGTEKYVQVSGLGPEGSEKNYNVKPEKEYKVAVNLSLALGKGNYMQLWRPDEYEIMDREVFEVVKNYIRQLKVVLL